VKEKGIKIVRDLDLCMFWNSIARGDEKHAETMLSCQN